MKLKHFEPSHFDKLVDFFFNAYPERSNHRVYLEYITKYLVVNQSEAAENIIITDDNDNIIIGINMLLATKLYYDHKIFSALWSHDTFVLPEFRNLGYGKLLTEYKLNKIFFSVGLSAKNKELYKKYKVNFIGTVSTYIKPNMLSYRALGFVLKFIKQKKLVRNFPDIIDSGGIRFEKVYDKNMLVTSDNGYCSEKIIEFNHDRDFLGRRYLFRPGIYTVYQVKNYNGNNVPFFVVRQIILKGVNCLLLVDYRVDINDVSFFAKILKALGHISRKTKVAAMLATASIDILRNILHKNLWLRMAERDIVTNFTKEELSVFVTPGDSDYEFNYSGNEWR